MVPTTLGATIAFVGLVLPGLVFTELRARAATPVSRDAFDRIGIVVVVSSFCTTAALAVLVGLGAVRPSAVIDMSRFLADQAYALDRLHLVTLNAVSVVLGSIALAVLIHRGLERSPGYLTHAVDMVIGPPREPQPTLPVENRPRPALTAV